MEEDIVENIRSKITNGGEGDIAVSKFMLIIKQYPNGRIYPTIIPIGVTKQDFSKKKKKRVNAKEQVILDGEEY